MTDSGQEEEEEEEEAEEEEEEERGLIGEADEENDIAREAGKSPYDL